LSSEFPPTAARLGEALEGYQAAVDDFDREVARLLGVNETDLRCLEVLLRDEPEATPRLLADRLGLTTGSVTSMLDRLERIGYLTRTPHPSDRRKVIVRATETATRRALELMGPLVAEGQEQLLARYSVEQLELIADFLSRAREQQQAHTRRLRQRRPYPSG
jgi:DNA-binding MarR family transcriptional regulator